MTLEEQFNERINYPFSEYKEQMKILKKENYAECEKIADNFAIGFADWLNKDKETKNRLKELLEIYKKEKGL